jgi:hypothetical protein
VADDSHAHTIGTITGLQSALDAKADDTEVATVATANKLLKLDANAKLPTSITGNADGNSATATKLQTARTIALSGDVSGSASFDGSGNISIVSTVADDSHNHTIATVNGLQTALNLKSDSSHNHDSAYLNVSGDSMVGKLGASKLDFGQGYDQTTYAVSVNTATPYTLTDIDGVALSVAKSYRVTGIISATGTLTGAVALLVSNDTSFTLYKVYESGTSSNHVEFYLDAGIPKVRLYGHTSLYSVSLMVESFVNNGRGFTELALINHKADVSNPHSVTKSQIGLGNVDNTADSAKNVLSATKITTPRTISLTGDVTGSLVFDGSANASMVATVADDSHNHIIGNVVGLQTALDAKLLATANAVSATKLQTARTIAFAGDMTGSAVFDGTANITITAVIADDSHNHAIGTVVGLQTALDSKVDDTEVATTATASKLLKLDANAKLPASITGNSDGNASTATKLETARTIALSGDVSGSGSFDGSGNLTITTVVADDSHSHIITDVDNLQESLDGKLSLIGGTMTGNVIFTDDGEGIVWSRNTDGAFIKFKNLSDADADSYLEFNVSDNGNEYFKWTTNTGGVFSDLMTLKPTAGNLWVKGSITASSLIGNASTATKLETARTIALSGSVSGSGSFDGSGNLTISTVVADDSHSHIIANIDGLQAELNTKLPSSSYTASDVLAKLKTVDGSGSGLDADTISGVGVTGLAPISGVNGSWRVGETIHNVANTLITSTPTEILIKTGIPFLSGSHMPVIHIQGYAYGLQSPVELKLGYYIYNNLHGYCGVVSMGAWRPTVKLFSYLGTDGTTKYTGIALIGSIYYPQFSVGVQTEMGGNYATGWTIENNSANNTVYNMPNTDVVTVPYKATFSQTINGVTFDGTSNITIADSTKEPVLTAGTVAQYYRGDKTWQALTKSSVGLANVDDTSDANKPISTAVQTALNAKASLAVATTTVNGLLAFGDKVKLDGIAVNANNYVHPSTHPATMIVQDPSNRFMTDTERSKLSNIEANANNYSHLTGDGNLHVPATSTTNNGKVLRAGATAGSLSWEDINWSEIIGKPSTFTATAHGHIFDDIAVSGANTTTLTSYLATELAKKSDTTHRHDNATQAIDGFLSFGDKTKLDGVSSGANRTLNTGTNGVITIDGVNQTVYTHPTGAGNNHIPTGGAVGNYLKYSSSGAVSWTSIVIADVGGLQTALDAKADDSEITTVATASKLLKLDVNAKLPASITGSADGNSATATQLQTARTISLSGDVTGSTTFDGSGNVSIVSTVADDSHNHTIATISGLQLALDAKLLATANAVSASKLETARTITLSGDVSGSAIFDGTGNITITSTVADNSHAHIIGDITGLSTALSGKAPTAHSHSGSDITSAVNLSIAVDTLDTRATNPLPNAFARGLRSDFKTNTTDALSDGGTYHGVVTYRQYADSSGGGVHQLGFTENGNLWHRKNATDTTWGTWYKIWNSNNLSPLTTSANQSTGSGFTVKGTSYVGDATISGELVVKNGSNVSAIHLDGDSSGKIDSTNVKAYIAGNGNADFKGTVAVQTLAVNTPTLVANLNSQYLNGVEEEDVAKNESILDLSGFGVQTGFGATAQAVPNMTVKIGAGTAYTSTGRRIVIADTSITVTTASTAYGRNDIIYLQGASAGANEGKLTIATGTATATPVDPAIPADGVKIARVRVPVNIGSITDGTSGTADLIDDIRVWKNVYLTANGKLYAKELVPDIYSSFSASADFDCPIWNDTMANSITIAKGSTTATWTHNLPFGTSYAVQLSCNSPEPHAYWSNKTSSAITINLDDVCDDDVTIDIIIIGH